MKDEIKEMLFFLAGIIVLLGLSGFVARQMDHAYEVRAIHSGYYCKDISLVNPKHYAKCERVEKGEDLRKVFKEELWP